MLLKNIMGTTNWNKEGKADKNIVPTVPLKLVTAL